ncbi:MAG TPA: hypothetical protein VGC13_12370 [Longimicrobium sp.]|jgi:hypothetical protein
MEPVSPGDYVRAVRDANFESDRTDRTVSLMDVDLQLRYAPEPGVEMRVQGLDAGEPVAGAESVLYEGAAERPASYPPGLPFLPGVKVSVSRSPAGPSPVASLMWNVPDAETALADLLAQCAASGWAREPEPDEPLIPGLRMIHLEREGRERMINVVSIGENAMISLVDSARE